MTFRDMAFQDELKIASRHRAEGETSLLQSLIDNQSPIMKFWFVLMVLNLAMFCFIIQ